MPIDEESQTSESESLDSDAEVHSTETLNTLLPLRLNILRY